MSPLLWLSQGAIQPIGDSKHLPDKNKNNLLIRQTTEVHGICSFDAHTRFRFELNVKTSARTTFFRYIHGVSLACANKRDTPFEKDRLHENSRIRMDNQGPV